MHKHICIYIYSCTYMNTHKHAHKHRFFAPIQPRRLCWARRWCEAVPSWVSCEIARIKQCVGSFGFAITQRVPTSYSRIHLHTYGHTRTHYIFQHLPVLMEARRLWPVLQPASSLAPPPRARPQPSSRVACRVCLGILWCWAIYRVVSWCCTSFPFSFWRKDSFSFPLLQVTCQVCLSLSGSLQRCNCTKLFSGCNYSL